MPIKIPGGENEHVLEPRPGLVQLYSACVGEEIDGVLGADVCRKRILHCGYGHTNVDFIAKLPRDLESYKESPLALTERGEFALLSKDNRYVLAPDSMFSVAFKIDETSFPTGFVNPNKTGKCHVWRPPGRIRYVDYVRFRQGSVAGIELSEPTVVQDGPPALGLAFLARAEWIFDFLSLKAYAKPHTTIGDFSHRFGLYFDWMSNRRLCVAFVQPGSEADRAGIKAGSEVFSIDNVAANQLSLAEVARRMTFPSHQTVRVTLIINGKQQSFEWKE